MTIFQTVSQLVAKGVEAEFIQPRDTAYVRNQLLGLLELDSFEEEPSTSTSKDIPDLVEVLVDYAVSKQVIEDILDEKEKLSANLMNCFLPQPSVVQDKFYQLYQEASEKATNYFYEFSKNSNYIQMKRIAKNIHYKTKTEYGELDITINLSKPEKDPEQIKRERETKQTSIPYPKCLLCAENEGYAGRIGHPARSNHRIIEVPLEGESWFLQYSPYVYYNEHSILLAEEHRDMKIDRAAFARLLAFVEKFPHYFIGSNADLPIVGGSILSHDHYQGGRYPFAMTKAKDAFTFALKAYPDIKASVVKWPLSVIRLQSTDKNSLIKAASDILAKWKKYSDPTVDILSDTDGTPHNTITPIARIRDSKFELDLVLRNNRTTEEHPLGIFHPHEDVHHIKKENIGLIEVMGLAVLPARLKDELAEIKKFLLGEANKVEDYHKEWAKQINQTHQARLTRENVDQILEDELGAKFSKVLEDSGVFKTNQIGREAFQTFLHTLNE
ncbi:UDP-glucose--hexose-1-phosphate uridylyltransferase [Aquibacillus salsiterrae]|uniref:Galactose-1-phosphate uridylyltransferase n=1 Tax=Aquibacillus salsiterrae TaxID=2950439 RepID=A0A9X3WGA6_9BACI|nr:UDP-glucose--hexose-1-phosphate uridylyltransferase [Aquibacillus salsiterrae]MDC3418113.1 UDP-glucose--hexose-1-phosphate uridylyltransferase [Aquibacillus salsiterrae]